MDVTTRLKALPHPDLPRDLTLDVLARVEAIEQSAAAEVSVTPARTMWLAPLATVLAAAMVTALLGFADSLPFRLVPFSGGSLRTSLMWRGTLQLLAGLALYVVGLLAPLRSGRRERTL